MENRRKKQRFRIQLPGKVRAEGQTYAIESANLSASGVRIVLDAPLLEGAEVKISLQLQEENRSGMPHRLTTAGTVVWCQEDIVAGYQAGIRFEGSPEGEPFDLESFLANFETI